MTLKLCQHCDLVLPGDRADRVRTFLGLFTFIVPTLFRTSLGVGVCCAHKGTRGMIHETLARELESKRVSRLMNLVSMIGDVCWL